MSEKIAFLGLGNLGTPIAEILLEAGYELVVWNRTASKAEPLTKLGATVVENAIDAITPGGIVFSVLADDAAVEELFSMELVEKLGKDGVHVSMSTISPETSRQLAQVHEWYGAHYVGAPIFARPEAVRAKVGNICLSGNAGAKERIKPIVENFVKGVFDFGDDPGAANVIKLAGNFMIACSLEMMGEAFTMAEKNGISRQSIYEMLTSTLFAAPIFQNYGKLVASNTYEPVAFRFPLGLKDINLTLQTASDVNAPMPFADIIRNRFISGLAKGRENLDWGALALGASDDAGLTK
ncbi:NAD(P)-dependent oxidoreductase [Dyadobacter fermentans]|uniref:6-phosphogluconate dehydrogenase NAD-binding n=2 Tax=Dyadobacter fermentans (strain ATCC 700827 / DSM 18053 / CIP 107007 / KCTC 52180 / NS114) TaxID=471854 RepID=C6VV20_DYAFD|nr:NAD(P)-dependent oxidoreductase [Dyadobacter fermentans]ACT94843.1 6-phosphogluconate dehydrogenase NAD-binding [Dyadobacter fermentans DSM 18053]